LYTCDKKGHTILASHFAINSTIIELPMKFQIHFKHDHWHVVDLKMIINHWKD
jgi:hypothetical protein